MKCLKADIYRKDVRLISNVVKDGIERANPINIMFVVLARSKACLDLGSKTAKFL